MGTRFFVILFGILIAGLLSGCSGGGGGGGGDGLPNPSTSASLVSIEVSLVNPTIALGTTTQLNATGIYSDHTTKDLTSSVTWQSSNTGIATVTNEVASSVSPGSATITAISGTISGSTTLTVTSVTLKTLQVDPVNPSVASGMTKQFTATGIFSDDSTQDLTTQATWSSTKESVASISNDTGSNGRATTNGTGSTTISATLDTVTGSTTLAVTSAALDSIQVTPTNQSISKGTTQRFIATGIYSDKSTEDLTTQVDWSSSNTSVAVISNVAGTNGWATSPAKGLTGSTTISATLGTETGSTTLVVTSATLVSIQVTPTNPSIPKGTTQQFFATGIYTDNSTQDLTTQVVWSSSDSSVAHVSNTPNSKGLATSLDVGSTVVTASLGALYGKTALDVTAATLVTIEVDPVETTIPLEVTQQFTATGIYTDDSTQDLTSQVTWSSTNPSVAAISNVAGFKGIATPVSSGSTTVFATLGLETGSTSLVVTDATLQSISLNPLNPKIAMGTSQQFTATGNYSDGSTYDLTNFVTWSSSDGPVATISNAADSNGLATPVSAGKTTITATSGAITSSTDLYVTAATIQSISITPPNPQMALKTTFQLTAIGKFSDGSTQDLTNAVTWSSASTTIATISNAAKTKGLATSVTAGDVVLTATFAGVSGSTQLRVFNAALDSITVTPVGPSIQVGKTLQFTATGFYSNGVTQDLTNLVLWKSSDLTVAKINNAKKRRGLVKGTATGTSAISARMSSRSGSTTLTVSK